MVDYDKEFESVEDMLTVTDEKGMPVIRIGLFLTFYIWDAHKPEVREGVVRCFEDYWKTCGDKLRWATKNTRWVRVGPKVPTPRETARTTPPDGAWQFVYHGGESIEESSDYRFRVLGQRKWKSEMGFLGYLSASFPLTYFADRPQKLPGFVSRWASWVRPFHGYGGVGILESISESETVDHQPAAYAIARRFPGIEADYPVTHALDLKDGIKGVNWLTVLKDHWLDKLGGLAKLRSQLGPEFLFHEYPGGVVIQAGPKPRMGDRNRRRRPELYVKLNTALRPIRVQKVRSFHQNILLGGPPRFDNDASQEYLTRFDE